MRVVQCDKFLLNLLIDLFFFNQQHCLQIYKYDFPKGYYEMRLSYQT